MTIRSSLALFIVVAQMVGAAVAAQEAALAFPPAKVEIAIAELRKLAPVVEIPQAHHHLMLDQPLALIAGLRAILAGWEHAELV